MSKAAGAPAKNANAAGHGLYSDRPRRHVAIPAQPLLPELALLAQDLADSALWIAEQLAVIEEQMDLQASRQIGLYASVAQELAQLTGELLGSDGIKPASLGQLGEEQFDHLMRKQVKALELIINQCAGATLYIRDREEILGTGGGLVMHYEEEFNAINPSLTYLAGHMRSAKRIIREMAANLAWKMRGTDDNDDLSTRIFKQIEG